MQDLNDKITGGTLTATEWNEVPSEVQNVIEALGQTLSSGDLDQLGKGIAGYVANGTFYTDTGIADAYVLTKIGSKQAATAYTDGFQASFLAGNTNTGASTVNIAGLGVKDIKFFDGSDPIEGDIRGRVDIAFDSGNDRFEILHKQSGFVPDGNYSIADTISTLQYHGTGFLTKSYGDIPVSRGKNVPQYDTISNAVLSQINPRGWYTDGNYAYVICQGTYNATQQGILDILDVRDKYNINLLSSINVGASGETPRAIAVYGNFVYVQSVGGILHIIDVTDKSSPSLVATSNLLAGNREYSIAIGDALIIPKQTNNLDFYSLRDPSRPEFLTTLTATGSFYQPLVDGNKVWVASHNDGTLANLLCVDISDPRNPVQLSFTTFASLKFARRGVIKGKYLYMGGFDTTSRLHIIDISDPVTPTIAFTHSTDEGAYVEIFGDTLIAGKNLYDITDPVSPILVETIADLISRPIAVGAYVLGLGPGTGASGPAGNDGNVDPTLRSLRISNYEISSANIGSVQAERIFTDGMRVKNELTSESVKIGSGGVAARGNVTGERVSSRGVVEITKFESIAVKEVSGDISSTTTVFEFLAENAHTSFELSYTLVDNQALAGSAAHTVGIKSFSGFVSSLAAYTTRITIGNMIAERTIGTASVLTVIVTSGASAGDPVTIGVSCPQLNIANSRAMFELRAICSSDKMKLDIP